MNKSWWLDIAEILDALRVFPRLLLLAAFAFTCWYSWVALSTVIGLVEHMPAKADATTAEMIAQNIVAGVIGLTVPMIGNMFAKISDIYLQTGRKWSGDK